MPGLGPTQDNRRNPRPEPGASSYVRVAYALLGRGVERYSLKLVDVVG